MTLLWQHAALVAASAISNAVAAARGYRSVATKAELLSLGFSTRQARAPALLIPVWNVHGEIALYQARPDEPRIEHGKAVKYETPLGSRMVLDVPPDSRAQLGDPHVPLVITEGIRKADAGASVGLCCIALLGVWNFRGTNKLGGKTALADWESIALNDRMTLVAFDSDVMTKPEVHQALARLKAFLESRHARVLLIYLPAGPGGAKVGLDDYLAAGHTVDELLALASDAMPSEPSVDRAVDIPSRPTATLQPPALASAFEILDLAADELAASGVAGETRTVKLFYLAVTSRLLEHPCSVVVKGPSAGGKSFVVEQVLTLFPLDAYYALSAMSERALAYDREPLVHRMLVLYEAAGVSGEIASYLMCSLLSEGRINYVTVVKTKNGLEHKHIVREGPTGLITTTTAVALHPENETRLLSLTVTDSAAQTRAIMLAHASGARTGRDRAAWHALQAWLAATRSAVVVPYAATLAAEIPPVAVRLRRDFATLLTLIRAHALLHQLRRARDADGRVLADVDDYAAVRELVSDVIADAAEHAVSATIRETVAAVHALTDERDPLDEGVPVTRVAAQLGLDKSSVLRRVRAAISRGYLKNLEDRRGRPARLLVGEPLPEGAALLPTTAALERLHGCSAERGDTEIPVELDYPRAAWDIDLPPAAWGPVQ